MEYGFEDNDMNVYFENILYMFNQSHIDNINSLMILLKDFLDFLDKSILIHIVRIQSKRRGPLNSLLIFNILFLITQDF